MSDDPLVYLVRKLRAQAELTDEAKHALLELPYVPRTYLPDAYIVREGSVDFSVCSLIVSGFAIRQKSAGIDGRQIVSINLRGDLLDLQHLFLKRADHNIQALTTLEVLNIDRAALQKLVLEDQSINRAMWICGLMQSARHREWILNVGRRPARQRVTHLLCEFAVRCAAAGLGDAHSCALPMTQEQIGDALALTNVHVSRTLKSLEEDGIIRRNKREISFDNWDAIQTEAGFDPGYLHIDTVGRSQDVVN